LYKHRDVSYSEQGVMKTGQGAARKMYWLTTDVLDTGHYLKIKKP